MNPFADQYKMLSNSELLWVIENPNDYQPIAVKAAESELVDRQLTADQFADARAENENQKNKKQAQIERKQAFEKNLKSTISSLGDAINPIQKQSPSVKKVISIISVVISLMFLVQILSLFSLLKFMFTDKSGIWDLSMVIYFLIIGLLPIGIALFWFRKKIGWVILTGYIVYSACYSIISLIELISIRYPENSPINNLFPSMSPTPILFKIFFFGGILWVLCRIDMRSIYRIEKRAMFITICSSFSFTILLYLFHALV